MTAAVLQHDLPASRLFAVVRRSDPTIQLDIAPQIELVSNVIEVTLGLGLGSEVLLPIPFLEKFFRERVTVSPALGVKSRTGIAVPVPRAANPTAGFKDPHAQTELAQFIELVKAGDAGAYDNRVKLIVLPRARLRPECLISNHACLLHMTTTRRTFSVLGYNLTKRVLNIMGGPCVLS